ncbi:MAG: Brp/Blh family beta-carotene 15,15'-monooxygenase [Salinirussus sp.]|jgi:Brp/Blh family beta-carotene 15,15'-monooxygenase
MRTRTTTSQPRTLRSLFVADSRPLTVARFALCAVIAVLGLRAAAVTAPMRWQAAVYLFGMVAMNLLHGGYEHVSNLRQRGLSFQSRYLALYLGGIAVFVGLFLTAPVAGLTLACGVAVAKGGHGGLHAMDATTGTGHLRTRPQRALAAAVRGGAAMVVPVFALPDTFLAFSSLMVGIFDPGALAPYTAHVQTTRLLAGGGFALAAVTHLGLGFRRRDGSGSWAADAVDTLLLSGYFLVVPVVVAVGVYFPAWYTARQVAREVEIDGRESRHDSERVEADILGFLGADDNRIVTLGAWGVLVVGSVATVALATPVYTLSPNPLGVAPPLVGAVAFWSVFVSIITLPHVVVGSWLDQDGGIWYVP